MTTHRHKDHRVAEEAFGYCVNPGTCVEGAHGNITLRQECECGARQSVNINGRWIERSGWVETPTTD